MILAYKSWLELRRRAMIALGVWFFLLIVFSAASARDHGRKSDDSFRAFAEVDTTMLLVFGAILAGNGVMTQSCGLASGRMGDSVLFTLSLPVSRRRVFLSRAAQGAVALVPMVLLFWLLILLLRQPDWPHSLIAALPFEYIGAALGYSLALLGLALLSEMVFGLTLGIAGAMAGIAASIRLGPVTWFFDFVSGAQYLTTGRISWAGVAACIVLSCVFVFAAVRIIERREF